MEMSVFNRFILCLIRNVEKTIKNMTAEKFVTNYLDDDSEFNDWGNYKCERH